MLFREQLVEKAQQLTDQADTFLEEAKARKASASASADKLVGEAEERKTRVSDSSIEQVRRARALARDLCVTCVFLAHALLAFPIVCVTRQFPKNNVVYGAMPSICTLNTLQLLKTIFIYCTLFMHTHFFCNLTCR